MRDFDARQQSCVRVPSVTGRVACCVMARSTVARLVFTARRYASAVKTKHAKSPVASASCPVTVPGNSCAVAHHDIVATICICGSDSETPFTRYNRLSNRFYNRFDNRLYRVNKHPTGCQTGCTTDLTTGCIHDTTGCQTGLTTGLTTGCIV